MRTLTFAIGGMLLTWSCAVWCVGQGGAQDRPKADMPKADMPKTEQKVDEDRLSPQELTNRLLVVRARLDKPILDTNGMFGRERLPEYELGEPILVELDIYNVSERSLFKVPDWGARQSSQRISVTDYIVEATRNGKPVPFTTLGGRSVEFLRRDLPMRAHYAVLHYDDVRPDPTIDDAVPPPTARVMVNVLCDMTDSGDYSLVVKFRVGVLKWVNGRPESVNTLKVVDNWPSRLRVVNRLYRLQQPPPPRKFLGPQMLGAAPAGLPEGPRLSR